MQSQAQTLHVRGVTQRRRIYSSLSAVFMVVGLMLFPVFTSGVRADTSPPNSPVLPYLTTSGGSENTPLQLYNGNGTGSLRVQHDPKVFLVFWGPNWNNETGTINTIASVFNALAGSRYNNILRQYWDNTGGDFSNKVTLMDDPPLIDASTPPSNVDLGFETDIGVWDNAQVRHEADHLISQHGWAVDQDTQIIVFPQSGTTYNHGGGFCGVHSYNSTASSPYAYSLVQYGDQNTGCNPVGDTTGDLAWTAVHEYTEAVTDPRIHANINLDPTAPDWYTATASGWHTRDTNATTPQEVADLCAGYDPLSHNSLPYYHAAGMALPYLWSNIDGGCVMAEGQEFASPDYNAPFHGLHTVQGAILDRYNYWNAANGPMGRPTTEELPIAGGRVSYFENGCGAGAGIYWSPATGAWTVWGCIMVKYRQLNEANGELGFPVYDETDGGGGSRVSYFAGTSWGSHCGNPGPYGSYGAIYWTSQASEVKGCMYDYYQGNGAASGDMGLPNGDEWTLSNGGHAQYFTGTSCGSSFAGNTVYDVNGDGVHRVKGCIRVYYVLTYNGPAGIGYPTSDEIGITGGIVQYFDHGVGMYDATNGPIHTVVGAIEGEYHTLQVNSNFNSFLGFPLTDEVDAPGGGRASYFMGTSWGSHCGNPGPNGSYGAIFWTGGTGAHEVHGCLYDAYMNRFGGPGGWMGYPIYDQADPYAGGHVQQFQHGYICDVNGNINAYSNNVYPAPC